MGLLLLIPGLVFLLNGTTWFSGEESVGVILTVIGSIILLLQVVWTVYVASKVKSTVNATRSSFDRW